jgi:hypothetical protein
MKVYLTNTSGRRLVCVSETDPFFFFGGGGVKETVHEGVVELACLWVQLLARSCVNLRVP